MNEVFGDRIRTHKHNTSVSNTIYFYIQWYICVRATCFDLVGHPQALQENISKSSVFLHYGIPQCRKTKQLLDLFSGGPEDDLLGRNMSP